MKIATFAFLSAAGMAATSLAVWTATGTAGPARATAEPRPGAAPAPAPAQLALPDLSQFTAGQTLMMKGRLGHAVLPAGSDSETFLFVDVTADAAQRAAIPASASLAIVIDKSGSMKGKRLTNALSAAR